MDKVFVVANWKCNPPTVSQAEDLFNSVVKSLPEKLLRSEAVFCPPFVYLPLLVKKGKSYPVSVGAQDCFWKEKGSFTGEVSSTIIQDLGCEYVIVGHSERRKYFAETDEMVNKKVKFSLKQGLTPIVCIDKLSQVTSGLAGLSEKEKDRVIVAYEPLWAIGSGEPCSYEDAKEFNDSLKDMLGEDHPTLYGGSVNAENARGFIEKSGFQGLLIGGASLRPDEFVKIIKLFEKE